MYNCVFCSIISKKIPADIIFENKDVLAFKDINPQAPQHVLIIPKKHISGVSDIELEDAHILSGLMAAVKEIAQKLDIHKTGYRLIINNGQDAGQAVPHLHLHILGGRRLNWPPG